MQKEYDSLYFTSEEMIDLRNDALAREAFSRSTIDIIIGMEMSENKQAHTLSQDKQSQRTGTHSQIEQIHKMGKHAQRHRTNTEGGDAPIMTQNKQTDKHPMIQTKKHRGGGMFTRVG